MDRRRLYAVGPADSRRSPRLPSSAARLPTRDDWLRVPRCRFAAPGGVTKSALLGGSALGSLAGGSGGHGHAHTARSCPRRRDAPGCRLAPDGRAALLLLLRADIASALRENVRQNARPRSA